MRQALVRYEPRIDVLTVQVALDAQRGDRLIVTIEYRVRSTDTVFNLVYPFYLERGAL